MGDRRQEKIGWFGGFLGGFVAVLIMSVVVFFRGKTLAGCVGLLLFGAAIGAAWYFAPWRHPRTRYWRLLVPFYLLLSAAVGWAVWAFGARETGLDHWGSLVPLVMVLLPLWWMGKQRWADRDLEQPDGSRRA